jgi:hypothetical protein
MDPRHPLSEESFRYAAECRRLARLARKPMPSANTGTMAYLRLLAWIGDVWTRNVWATNVWVRDIWGRDVQTRYMSPARHVQLFGRPAGPGHR